ncbi:hypothetical protein B0H12DRAFT_1244160 [Mycena haematopus]|nr:hypothetical protein B0H12DRAFT_1244160 [Mycena haematopus]
MYTTSCGTGSLAPCAVHSVLPARQLLFGVDSDATRNGLTGRSSAQSAIEAWVSTVLGVPTYGHSCNVNSRQVFLVSSTTAANMMQLTPHPPYDSLSNRRVGQHPCGRYWVRAAPIKKLITDTNFECNEEGVALQAIARRGPLRSPGNCWFQFAKDDAECTLNAADEACLVYEARNRIAEYDMKLMDIDSDTLGIPKTDYDEVVCRGLSMCVLDLGALGESVRIEVSKEGVKFASEGESANGSILLKTDKEIGLT